jgi:DNA-binding protein H-NS
MFLHTLKEQLDKEAAEKKKQQKADMRQQASMRSQINEYMKHHSPLH